jgi:hypothetical protein
MTQHLTVLRHLTQPSMENRIQRLAKERLCRRNTALTAKEKVDRFSLFVDRSIQVMPFASNGNERIGSALNVTDHLTGQCSQSLASCAAKMRR